MLFTAEVMGTGMCSVVGSQTNRESGPFVAYSG